MAQVQVNLLTKEFRGTGASVVDGVIRWLVIISLLGIVALGAWQYIELYGLSGDQASVKSDLDITKKKAVEVQTIKSLEESVKKTQTVVQNLKNALPSNNSLLAIIQSKIPPGVTLQSQAIKDGAIDLRIEAISLLEVEKLVDSLRSEKSFSGVEIQTLSQDPSKPVQSSITLKYGKGVQGK